MEIRLASINNYIEKRETSPTESLRGNMYYWGLNNLYPEYILDLYDTVPTLHSLIDGVTASILGKTYTTSSLIPKIDFKRIVKDYIIFGGAAFQVVYQKDGNVNHLEYVDISKCRVNQQGDIIYSDNWKYSKSKHVLENGYMIGDYGRRSYPTSLWSSAIIACEIEKSIQQYHLNAINNSFTGSYLVNINGDLQDSQKDEVERNFNSKFTGKENAGRVAFSFNGSGNPETTITPLQITEFGEQYQALAEYSRQQIFTAFRVNPNIYGISTENLGFSKEEYQQSAKLYDQNIIIPIREEILEFLYNFIPGDSIEIEPLEYDNL